MEYEPGSQRKQVALPGAAAYPVLFAASSSPRSHEHVQRSKTLFAVACAALLVGLSLVGPCSSSSDEPELQPGAQVAQALSAPAEPPAELVELLPGDAFAVALFESAQTVDGFASGLLELFEAPVRELSVLEWLAARVGVEPDQFDPSRPLGLAWTLPEGGFPQPTFVLPLAEPADSGELAGQGADGAHGQDQPRRADADEERWTERRNAAVAGSAGYIAYSRGQQAEALPEGSADEFLAGLALGAATLRIDLERVIALYRPVVDTGLARAESMFAEQAAEQASGMDVQAMLSIYFDALRAFLDSAQSLDVTLSGDQRRLGAGLRFESALHVLPDSPMSRLPSGAPTSIADLAHAVDPDAAVIGLLAADWGELHDVFAGASAVLAASYPEGMRALMQRQFATWNEIADMLGGAAAFSGGFGRAGMRFSYVLETRDPAAVIATYRAMVTDLVGLESSGVHVSDLRELEREGRATLEYAVSFDDTFFELMMGGQGLGDEALAEAKHALEMLYGPDGVRIRLLPGEGLVGMTFGGDELFVAQTLARMDLVSASRDGMDGARRPGSAPLPLDALKALESVRGSNPAGVLHLDVARVFSQLWETLRDRPGAERPDTLAVFDDLSVPVTVYLAVDDLVWRCGGNFDFAGLAALVEAVRSEKQRPPAATVDPPSAVQAPRSDDER